MRVEDSSSRSAKSSVWIDPAYMLPNAPSPIPPRASAQRSHSVRVPLKYRGILVTPRVVPLEQAPQSPLWQYDSPDYEIESTIADLSLVDELPTRPEEPVGAQFPVGSAGALVPVGPRVIETTAELPTRPQVPAASLVAELPTRPEPQSTNAALVDLPINRNTSLVSWTAGGAEQSPLAQRLIERRARGKSSSSVHLNALDRVRWWLLKAGHIEFLAWLAGTILLIVVSLALLFTTSLSFGWLTIGALNRFSSSPGNQHPLPTIVTNPGLKLELLDKGPLLPGQSIHLHGQGFTRDREIFFTYDNMQPFPSQDDMTQADARGTFTVTLTPETRPQWYAGQHLIEARDLATGYLAVVQFTILASPNGSNGTSAPGSTVIPGKGTPTPASGSGKGNTPTPGPNPGGQTPNPITPTATVGISPTPTLSPSPSPTATKTPTPTSTPTKTPTPTPPTPTPGVTPTP